MANVNVQSYFLVREYSQNSGRVLISLKDSHINFTNISSKFWSLKTQKICVFSINCSLPHAFKYT